MRAALPATAHRPRARRARAPRPPPQPAARLARWKPRLRSAHFHDAPPDQEVVLPDCDERRDSRAGDPDLHTHLTVSNKVRARGHDGIYRWLALDGRPLFKGNGWLLRGNQGGVALDDPRAQVAGLRYFRLVAGDPPGARPRSPLTSCESRRARRPQPGQPHGRRCAPEPTTVWCAPAGPRPRSGRRPPPRPRGRARCSSQPR
jgi:TrwC relaxase